MPAALPVDAIVVLLARPVGAAPDDVTHCLRREDVTTP